MFIINTCGLPFILCERKHFLSSALDAYTAKSLENLFSLTECARLFGSFDSHLSAR